MFEDRLDRLFSRFRHELLQSGGGSGSGGGTTSTVTTQELSPEQRELLRTVIPTAKDFAANPPTLFPGSTITPFNPLEQQAQQQALGAAGGQLPQVANSAIGATGALQGPVLGQSIMGQNAQLAGQQMALPAQQFLLSGDVLNPESNPALGAAIQGAIRPITQQFENTVLPGIRNEANLVGGLGGSRQGVAEGLASQAYLDAVGSTAAGMQNEAYQSGLGALIGGLGPTLGAGASGTEAGLQEAVRSLFASPSLPGLALAPATVTGGVGAQQRGLEQAQLSEEAQRYLAEQLLPFAAAQDVAALAFGFPGGTVTSTGTFDRPGGGLGSLISGGLGGAASGAALGGAFGQPGAGAGVGGLLGVLSGIF